MSRAVVAALAVLISLLGAGCSSPREQGPRVVVLGFDGMDYGLASELMAEGRMPHFARVAAQGSFAPLRTSVPPQSPVAWSNFITGDDPSGHGIYDFLHRDPSTRTPYLSMSRVVEPSRSLTFGRYRLPLGSGRVELLRRGRPFWDALERHGVRTTIVRMPANFPPSGSAHRELSGMGTPDLVGSYGSFSYYTSASFAFTGRQVAGGEVHRVTVRGGRVEAALFGPDNPFLRDPEKVVVPFTVWIDATRPLARIVVGGEERVLQAGEWSDWVPVEFTLMPWQRLRGMVRFYLRQVRPDFELYASPVNINPLAPALPISTPGSFAADLARATGRYYTQGMPEDTKALEEGVFDRDEFLAQARLAGEEVKAQLAYLLDRFEDGLLFFYVGNLDQLSHVFWRPMDPAHPAYDPVADPPYRDVIRDAYVELDRVVGETLDRIGPETTLIVMSDHGFTSWRRAFHLNSWLRDEGYLTLRDPSRPVDLGFFANVDWSRSRAYRLGLNGLYVNLAGREPEGAVPETDRDALLAEVGEKLLRVIDPVSGDAAISKVYRPDRIFGNTRGPEGAPDLIIGYAKGFRCSNESALGGMPREVIVDNTSPWSGDHCMDHEVVPGLLLTSRPLGRPADSLEALAGSLLAEFGIRDPAAK